MAFPDAQPLSDLPSPPFLTVPGIANFRDIGGYPCIDNNDPSPSHPHSSIRCNLVFRCADPSKITPDGLTKLNDLGVKRVFDLRSAPEIKREGPMWEGVEIEKEVFVTREQGEEKREVEEGKIERIWCPVFAQRDYGPESVALRYRQYARNGSEVSSCLV